MPKAPPVEQQLLDLSALRADAQSPIAREKFTAALKGKNNLLAARAALIVTETNQPDYLPLLAAAFDRFFADGSDKGCTAKTTIANGLYTFGYSESVAFLRGIHHKQLEGSWGPPVDTAAELRGICALGLVRLGYRDVLLELAELLMDKESQPRQMAARAVAYSDIEDGALLLRMKVLMGDVDPDVIAECFTGLMKLTPKKSLDFVARFLNADDPATVQSAALAIGSSRLPEAFELLRKEFERQITSDARRPLLLAIATTRQPAAIEFMMERITDESPRPAADAVAAMGMYKHDDAIKSRIGAVVKDRNDRLIAEAFAKSFP